MPRFSSISLRLTRPTNLLLGVVLIPFVAGVLTLGSSLSATAQTPAAGEDAVRKAHQAMVEAYEQGDVPGFVSLFDTSAEFSMFHPMVRNRFDGLEALEAGLTQMFAHMGSSTWTEAHLRVSVHGDVAWITSNMALESESLQIPIVGRSTEVWLGTDEGWKLAHIHISADPEFNPPKSY